MPQAPKLPDAETLTRAPQSHEPDDRRMSGETETNVSGWTTDTVHSQIMTLFDERDKRHTAALAAVVQLFNTRLTEYDKAISILQTTTARSPTPGELDLDMTSFKVLVDEKFGGIMGRAEERFKTVEERFTGVDLRFKERDTRSERESRDNKVAVDAAFAAQKEAASEQNKSNTLAIDKSEKSTAETLNKQADLFKSTTDALDGRIQDDRAFASKLDSRLTAIESRGVVVRETQTQGNWQIGAMFSGLAVLISLGGLIVVLVKLG